MRRRALLAVALLSGCAAPPPDRAAGWQVVALADGRTALLPNSCAGPSEPSRRRFVPLGFAPRRGELLLPAGCAHDLALLRTVETPEDLLRGRVPEPGPGGPAARAAERYINRGEFLPGMAVNGSPPPQQAQEAPSTPPAGPGQPEPPPPPDPRR